MISAKPLIPAIDLSVALEDGDHVLAARDARGLSAVCTVVSSAALTLRCVPPWMLSYGGRLLQNDHLPTSRV